MGGDAARLASPVPGSAAPQQPLSDERHTSNQVETTSGTAIATGGGGADNSNDQSANIPSESNKNNNNNPTGANNAKEQDVEFTFTGGHLRDTTEYAERPVLDIEDTHLTFAADSDRSIDEERSDRDGQEPQRGRSQHSRFAGPSGQHGSGLSREVLSRLEATRPKSRALVGDWLQGPTQYQVDPMEAMAGPSSGSRFSAPDPQEQMRVLAVNTKMSTQHPCSNCERVFNNKSELRHHARRYEKRPYNCDQCERAFLYPKDLRRHKTTHSGSKQYRCSSCPKSFSRKDNLRRHSNNEHGAGGAPRSPSVDAINHPRGRRRDPSEDSDGAAFDPRGTAQGALAFQRTAEASRSANDDARAGSPSRTGGGGGGGGGSNRQDQAATLRAPPATVDDDNAIVDDDAMDTASSAATPDQDQDQDQDMDDADADAEMLAAPTVTTTAATSASRDSLVDSVMQGRMLPPLVAKPDDAAAAFAALQDGTNGTSNSTSSGKPLDSHHNHNHNHNQHVLLKPLSAPAADASSLPPPQHRPISEMERAALIEAATRALPSVRDILRADGDGAAARAASSAVADAAER